MFSAGPLIGAAAVTVYVCFVPVVVLASPGLVVLSHIGSQMGLDLVVDPSALRFLTNSGPKFRP